LPFPAFAGDAQLHRRRNAVAKNLPRAQISAQKSARCRNADELRVSALSQFLPRRESSTRQRYLAGKFFAYDNARAVNSAPQKKFCSECLYGRVAGPDAAQNVRISAK
jgi:hypothetical protein